MQRRPAVTRVAYSHRSGDGADGSIDGYLVRSPSTRAMVAASMSPIASPRGEDAGIRQSLSATIGVDAAASAPLLWATTVFVCVGVSVLLGAVDADELQRTVEIIMYVQHRAICLPASAAAFTE